MKKIISFVSAFFILFCLESTGSELVEAKVVDRDFLLIHFKDGEVKFVDDGTGSTAYAGHSTEPDNSNLVTYGEPLKLDILAEAGLWKIVSDDDINYGRKGVSSVAVFRKTRVNGMSYTGWDPEISDHGFDYTKEHFSDVWTADFTGFNKPGTYRLVVEGVGASQDFEIRDDIYRI